MSTIVRSRLSGASFEEEFHWHYMLCILRYYFIPLCWLNIIIDSTDRCTDRVFFYFPLFLSVVAEVSSVCILAGGEWGRGEVKTLQFVRFWAGFDNIRPMRQLRMERSWVESNLENTLHNRKIIRFPDGNLMRENPPNDLRTWELSRRITCLPQVKRNLLG